MGEKTAKMMDFTDKTPVGRREPKVSGIYRISSKNMRTVGFFVSRDLGPRLRKLRSDYRLGKASKVLDRLGIRWSGDVEIEGVEECAVEIFGIRLRRLAEEWIGQGYSVYGWAGGNAETMPGNKAGEWGPCGRLRDLAERHGMTDAEVDELLGQMDTVLGAGASPTGGGGD